MENSTQFEIFQVTHSCNTPWADNWKVDNEKEDEKDKAEHDGLSEFGKKVRTPLKENKLIDQDSKSVEMVLRH